jgi:hypothetical protein
MWYILNPSATLAPSSWAWVSHFFQVFTWVPSASSVTWAQCNTQHSGEKKDAYLSQANEDSEAAVQHMDHSQDEDEQVQLVKPFHWDHRHIALAATKQPKQGHWPCNRWKKKKKKKKQTILFVQDYEFLEATWVVLNGTALQVVVVVASVASKRRPAGGAVAGASTAGAS